MFFKRIETVGFKSFATKVQVDFIPGTTVIVGPNGCGKSNIFDAIKWVLGEQTASQMRGKKMQDVIFAGSASFKALGVAQVTVTIDNSDRKLPIDYDEIQITRRLFRSGDSEYLMNKQACRLKDIHNLFLGTGVGKSAYSMLEQGRVDQIINAKPAERRFLIEEAAGISKFKIRKLEALRKLERTDIDLSRLNDLLTEVERQVATLKRQASKAERYKELFDNCRRAEQELIVLRSSDLRTQLKNYHQRMNECYDKLMALRTELDAKMAAEEQARDEEAELNDRVTDERQAQVDLLNNLKECEHQITRLNDQIGTHAHRMRQIQAEFEELDVRACDIDLRIQEAEKKLRQAEESHRTNVERDEALTRSYSEMEAMVTERALRIDRMTQEVAGLREALSRAENEVRMAEALIENHTRISQEAETLHHSLEESYLTQALRFDELEQQTTDLNASIEKLQADYEEVRAAQRQRQESLVGTMRELEDARKQLHEGRSRLHTLKELSSNYEGYYQGVREAMLAADRNQLRGLLGVTANLIRSSKEIEVAIEVALATHLQDIVTRTAEDAKQAIEHLKRCHGGRATFLPLDRLQATPLAQNLRQILSRPGVLGLASDLVQYDRQIDTAVQFMLGTTIVVKALDVGLDLGRQGFRGRYVSLDGQLINPGGSMTGGSIKATGLMTREREIRDLTTTVEGLEAQQKTLMRRIEETQIALAQGHEKQESLKATLDQQQIQRASLSKELENVKRGRDDSERALAERQQQIEKIGQEIAARQADLAVWNEKIQGLRLQLTTAEESLTAERDAAREHGDTIMQLQTSVAESRAEIKRASERMVEAKTEIQAHMHDLESITRQRQVRGQEIETLKAEDGRLQEQIDRIQGETDEIRVEYEAMTTKLTQAQGQRDELVARVKQLAQEVEKLTRDERLVDNEYREVELRHTELQTNLNNISEQCQEKFNRSIEELAEAVGELGEDKDPQALQLEVTEMREKLDRIGLVNMAALEEYQEQAKRLAFLQAQKKDLSEAKQQLEETIAKLDENTRTLFQQTFEAVRQNFIDMFRRLFNGGKSDLILDAPEGVDPLLDGGVEILAQPPGKKLQSITLMSGGEKAMTAIALLFSLFLYKPSPFCIMDEIDAPLDDVNVERFKTVLREFAQNTQFLIITHNKLTMELGDAIYGVTMEESGVSKIVSVRFEQAEELVDAV